MIRATYYPTSSFRPADLRTSRRPRTADPMARRYQLFVVGGRSHSGGCGLTATASLVRNGPWVDRLHYRLRCLPRLTGAVVSGARPVAAACPWPGRSRAPILSAAVRSARSVTWA